MIRKYKNKNTKLEIIKAALKMFLANGYSNTSIKAISSQVGISTGNLTFHFPTKEYLLSVLVELLCDYQWKVMKEATKEGQTRLMALCLELTSIVAICESSELEKDFYIASYTNPMTLNIIRKNDIKKAKNIFNAYC